jgi:hypothetical protein
MARSTADYLDLTTDFGFKKFLRDQSTLIRFLNSILQLKDPVKSVYAIEHTASEPPTSAVPETPESRKRSSPGEPITQLEPIPEEEAGERPSSKTIRFDLGCITQSGLRINVEIQKSKQRYFFDSALFYSARLVSRQGWSGKSDHTSMFARAFSDSRKRARRDWDWELYPTYHIAVLDFDFFTPPALNALPCSFNDSWMIWSNLAFHGDRCIPCHPNQYENSSLLNICLISLPKFREFMADISSECEELYKFVWLLSYIGKKNGDARQIPEEMLNNDFKEIIDRLGLCKLNASEVVDYEKELYAERDNRDSHRTSELKGIEIGREIGREEGREETLTIMSEFLKLKATIGSEQAYKKLAESGDKDTIKILDMIMSTQV